MDTFLVAIGVDEAASSYAKSYLIMLLPTVLLNSWGDSIDLFLISMGFNNIVCVLQLIVIPIHFFFCWLFVAHFEFQIIGAGIASNLTAMITLTCQVVYVSSLESIKEAWYCPTRHTFQNLWPFLKLALPGMLILLIENLNMEILIILAALLNDIE